MLVKNATVHWMYAKTARTMDMDEYSDKAQFLPSFSQKTGVLITHYKEIVDVCAETNYMQPFIY